VVRSLLSRRIALKGTVIEPSTLIHPNPIALNLALTPSYSPNGTHAVFVRKCPGPGGAGAGRVAGIRPRVSISRTLNQGLGHLGVLLANTHDKSRALGAHDQSRELMSS